MSPKHKYSESELKKLLKTIIVCYDGREQENSHILNWFKENNISYEKVSLSFGDYSYKLPKNESFGIFNDLYFFEDICIERKNSVDEIIGNFATDRTRIEDELMRHKGFMQIVIEQENGYNAIKNGEYRSKYSSKSAIGTLHSLSLRYNCPFTFIDKINIGLYIYCTFYYHLRNYLI